MESVNLLEELDSISKIHTLKRDDIDNIMIEFAKRILTALKIERMSVWLFNDTKDKVVSMGEYNLTTRKLVKENVLSKEKYPTYFQSISENAILLVENVFEHKATVELSLDYSVPNNVISLMDIPLRICGELIGIMCFEKTGTKERVFTSTEQTFALSLALVFASTLEARQRRVLQQKLDDELKQKVLLIKEVHHRIKNNLSIISSLINLQSTKVRDEYHKTLFEDHRTKIDSIALIHELVYKSKNLSEISIHNYLREIAFNLEQAFSSETKEITISLDVDEVYFELDIALPLGLIFNEVVTNSYKHAFKSVNIGHISVLLKHSNNLVIITIADNGKGIDITHKKEQSLGMEILLGLVEQIDGKHSFENKNGTVFSLNFTLKKPNH
jgi:two-component sensor histidine kinase